jgi:hypothetical protein
VPQGKGQAAAPPTQTAKAPTKPKKEFYTVEEVAQHSSSDDCWIIIEDKVRALTLARPCGCALDDGLMMSSLPHGEQQQQQQTNNTHARVCVRTYRCTT